MEVMHSAATLCGAVLCEAEIAFTVEGASTARRVEADSTVEAVAEGADENCSLS